MEETVHPKIIQVEPTNVCNFSCLMCLNTYRKNNPQIFFSDNLFLKLAKENFSLIERLVLYGQGEPLMHRNFLKFLVISRKYLPEKSSIFFSTNGSLMDKKKVDYIIENNLADEIAFSCEALDLSDSSSVGHSEQITSVNSNLKYLAEHKRRETLKVGVQTVVTKSNFRQLPKFVKQVGDLGADYLSMSQIYPLNSVFAKQTLYTMITKEALSILKEIGEGGWNLILGYLQERFAEKTQHTYKNMYKFKNNILEKKRPKADLYYKYLNRAKKENVHLNISLFMEEKKKLPLLKELEEVFMKCINIANDYKLKLKLPEIVPSFKKRECPYISSETTIIRSDGEVVPCFNYLYDHKSFLNQHERYSQAFSYGNIKNASLKDIWNTYSYKKHRAKLKKINEKIPYCGDCALSTNNCFYATEGTSDCWGNEPFCSECPYSLNLTRCLL